MPPKKAALPTKERTLFQRLIQEYETKKYKLGLKTADTILKKFPEHGETLSMKGLLLGSMNQRTEGIELAKKGVRYDLTSFICWHALGILNRMDKNYEEAIKCYSQALRIEGGANINLLRESAFLQLQLRNFPPLIENRLLLLRIQPHLRLNWIALATAHHLAGSLDQAVRVLEGYENTMRDIPDRNFEHSEVLLYHASILEEKTEYQKALDLIQEQDKRITDIKGKQEAQARCLAALGKTQEAEKVWRSLIRSNAENKHYFAGLLKLNGIDTSLITNSASSVPASISQEVRDKAVDLLKSLQEEYPKSTAAKRISLSYATGADFTSQATSYVTSALTKGIPSLFSDLKSLYVDPAKQAALEEIVEKVRLEWTPPSDSTSQSEEATEPPTSYLWSLYYLAQHYSLVGDSVRALHYIDSAISHSSTLPELYMVRARILKRGGDLLGACSSMHQSAFLDGQDRFLNSKSSKYLLLTNSISEAEQMVGKFTKPDAPSPSYDLNEMQGLWYLFCQSLAYQRVGDYGMSLKRLHQLKNIFQEFWDDQLDFHSYCMRKMTLRSYVKLVRFEDNLRSHEIFFKAALEFVNIATMLADNPSTPAKVEDKAQTNGDNQEGENGEVMSESKKKKLAKKARKAAQEAAEAAKKLADSSSKDDSTTNGATAEDENAPTPDPDPHGTEVFNTTLKSPLKECHAWLRFLQQHSAGRVETWNATFEVAIREKNWLVCLRSLSLIRGLDVHDPNFVEKLVRLKTQIPNPEDAPQPISTVIKNALSELIPAEKPLSVLYTEFLQSPETSNSVQHRLGAAKAALALSNKEEAVELLLSLPKLVPSLSPSEPLRVRQRNEDLKTCIKAKELLVSLDPSKETEFNEVARSKFPLANAFSSPQELERKKQRLVQVGETWMKARQDDEEDENSANGQTLPLM